MSEENQEHPNKGYKDLKVFISFVIVIIIAAWFSKNLQTNLKTPVRNVNTSPAPFESKNFPLRSKQERAIWNAIYDNNHSTLALLLHNQNDYFDQDNEKINYSKVGSALLEAKIELPTVQLMYTYGLNLNDLKEVEISWDVQSLLEEHNITIKDVDLIYLPTDIQEEIIQHDLDLGYYRNKNIDEYYIVLLAKRLPSNTVLSTLKWLLEHGYEPEPTALGYLFTELIERDDLDVNATLVEQYAKYGLHFTSSKKDNMVHNDYNSFTALQALFYSGRMDDNDLLMALKEQGMSINSEGFFNHNLMYQLCHAEDDLVEAHEQGVANLIKAGLILTYRDDLQSCSKRRLRLIQKLANGKAPPRVQELKNRAEPSLSYKVDRMFANPIFMVYFAIAMLILLSVIAIVVLVMVVKAVKKKV